LSSASEKKVNPIRFRNRKKANSRVRVEARRRALWTGAELGIAGEEVGIGIGRIGVGGMIPAPRQGRPANWLPAAAVVGILLAGFFDRVL
jgi:hypothetical protein